MIWTFWGKLIKRIVLTIITISLLIIAVAVVILVALLLVGNNTKLDDDIGKTGEEEKETPSININIVNNEELEKTMYESDN